MLFPLWLVHSSYLQRPLTKIGVFTTFGTFYWTNTKSHTETSFYEVSRPSKDRFLWKCFKTVFLVPTPLLDQGRDSHLWNEPGVEAKFYGSVASRWKGLRVLIINLTFYKVLGSQVFYKVLGSQGFILSVLKFLDGIFLKGTCHYL